MPDMDPFLLNLPRSALEHPLMLESSAGTGKTYSLTRLVLAYLLYRDIPLDKILVITFTRNATAELKDRMAGLVREKLADPSLDTDLKSKLLQISADFDSLNITTINSFLQQIFQNNSLEIAVNPRLKPSEDKSRLNEAAHDYFRRFAPLFDEDRRMQLSLQAFTVLIRKKNNFTHEILKNFSDCFPWLTDNILNKAFLEEQNIFPKESDSQRAWQAEEEYFSGKGPVYALFHNLRIYHPEILHELNLSDELMKKTDSITQLLILLGVFKSSSPWTSLCRKKIRENNPKLQELHEALLPFVENDAQSPHLAAMASFFLRHFHHHANLILKEKQERMDLMRMEDPTVHLYNLLQNESENDQIRKLRSRYYVALIDEFQDTGYFQWAVLHKLFRPGSDGPHTYALIGDPKQLIYYFRGITPQTYMNAKRELLPSQIYRLQDNFRSHENLISGINFWFSRLFSDTEHGYVPVHAGSKSALRLRLADNDKETAGITFLSHGNSPEFLKNEDAEKISFRLCVRQIEELLHNENYFLCDDHTGEQRRVCARDIACLVFSHSEGKKLKKLLDERHIPNTLLENNSSIYETEEFEHMLLLLKVLAHPDSRPLRSRVLLSPLFHLAPEQILPTAENLPELEKFYILFNTWRTKADDRKIAQVFDQIFYNYGYFQRILAQNDGERRFVNMRHLVSIVLREERTAGINSGPGYLYQRLKSLKEQNTQGDFAKIRLETDADAVRILNIHQAKGLEYTIVFGIFGIKCIPKKNTDFAMQKDQRPVLDMALSREISQEHLQETLRENMRKFYVMATRAKSHLFLPLILTKSCSYYSYALLSLIDQTLDEENDNNKTWIKKGEKIFDWIQNQAQDPHRPFHYIEVKIEEVKPPIPSQNLPKEILEDLSTAVLRHTSGFNHRIKHISSYTSVWQNKESDEEEDFLDEIIPHNEEDIDSGENSTEITPLNLPGGASLGNAFHAVMENLPFHLADRPLEEFLQNPHVHDIVDIMISRHMSIHYHYNREYIQTVKKMVWNSLNTPIKELDGFRLAELQDTEKLHETEFLLHVPKDCLLCAPSFQAEIKNGYIRGFLDLVFSFRGLYFILDWKTTRLGPDQQAYNNKNLSKAMLEHGYDMQALIYSYALREHLRTEFNGCKNKIGSVIYVFSRGVSPLHPTDGINVHPAEEEKLNNLFRETNS